MIKRLLQPTVFKRIVFFVAADALLSLVSLYMAYLLRFNFHIPSEFLGSFWKVYGVILFLKIPLLYALRIYHAVWRFFSLYEVRKFLWAHLGAYGGFVLIYALFPGFFSPFPRSVIVIDAALSFLFLGGLRFLKRLILEGYDKQDLPKTLIIGSGSRAAAIIQSAFKGEIPYRPTAIVSLDGDDNRYHTYINNIKVYPPDAVDTLLSSKAFRAAIFTESMDQPTLKRWTDRLHQAGIYDIKKVKLLGNEHETLENLSIEDLLARRPKDLDKTVIQRFIQGKRILITGAGGSIGSEIVRQCLAFGAASLVLVDNGEYNLYAIGEEAPDAALHLMSVTDRQAIFALMEKVKPDVVIHAAAYKHVPLCEANPDAAVRNNVAGTQNVVDAAIACGVSRLVIVSTDKAVRPTNVMGATKRVTELYAQNVDAKQTEIVSVRFGNVLGSSGSVIPKFKAQIEKGGPVTVTHPEMTRYFMLIPEACQLVLQAAAIAKGGELFILDMGEPVKIVDLAKQMIRLYGKEGEVKIVYTGLRPGEKLYEELLLDEKEEKTKYRSIYITKSTPYPIGQLTRDIEELLKHEDKVSILRRIVPEYKPQRD